MALTADERQRLAGTLRCTDAELDARLALCGQAALSEYVDMFLGRKLPQTVADLREYRLLQLIRAGALSVPQDQVVANLFQLPMDQARRLNRNVFLRYRFELERPLQEALRTTLSSARQDPNDEARFHLTIESRPIAEALNNSLLEDGGQSRLTLLPRSQTRYSIDRAALLALVDKLGATAPPTP